MPKPTTIYHCTHCDAQSSKWAGRCLECGKWGSIEEQGARNKEQKIHNHAPGKTKKLSDIESGDITRISTHISELDRVLGGGIVPGSLILLGGEPGIGKSTLSLQFASSVPHTLYISGEESVAQIKLRADRIMQTQHTATLALSNETNVDTICATIRDIVKTGHCPVSSDTDISSQQDNSTCTPSLVIIDSIQTIYSNDATGEQGNSTQIKACTAKLLECAKTQNISIVIIGHVTKDGAVAGPRTLEHLVDTVLYLEGDRYHSYRILRGVKNRFGATDEVGIFEMNESGLESVDNPSAVLLEERGENAPGSVVTCLIEGTRPLLVEVQALVNKTSFGYPVRKASGFDLNRLHVLTAVLQKRAQLDLGQYDIHVNVVGGMKAQEPAADLAICLAIASSFKDKALGKDLVVFGEVGLGGEVRSVSHAQKRTKESINMGMKRIITHEQKPSDQQNIKIINVNNIADLITHT